MSDGRRWRNIGEGNQTVFMTTTVQGFTPVFADIKIADTITVGILADLKHMGASLYGFVVMPEHVHLLLRLPSEITASNLANVKSKAARRVLAKLNKSVRRKHELSRTLKDRVLWQRSFRSVIVDADRSFTQKLEYIHNNPVKRGLCTGAQNYKWSSAWIWSQGMVSEHGIDLADFLRWSDINSPPQGVAR